MESPSKDLQMGVSVDCGIIECGGFAGVYDFPQGSISNVFLSATFMSAVSSNTGYFVGSAASNTDFSNNVFFLGAGSVPTTQVGIYTGSAVSSAVAVVVANQADLTAKATTAFTDSNVWSQGVLLSSYELVGPFSCTKAEVPAPCQSAGQRTAINFYFN